MFLAHNFTVFRIREFKDWLKCTLGDDNKYRYQKIDFIHLVILETTESDIFVF